MHLANAQMDNVLASLIRRCEMELWETRVESVRAEHDFLLQFSRDGLWWVAEGFVSGAKGEAGTRQRSTLDISGLTRT